MANNLFQEGNVTKILTPVGKNSRNQTRFVEYPLQIINLPTTSVSTPTFETVVSTRGLGGGTLTLATDADDYLQAQQDWGYYTGDTIVIEPHQWGADNTQLTGLHSLGFV
jgi:hypothetical protein